MMKRFGNVTRVTFPPGLGWGCTAASSRTPPPLRGNGCNRPRPLPRNVTASAVYISGRCPQSPQRESELRWPRFRTLEGSHLPEILFKWAPSPSVQPPASSTELTRCHRRNISCSVRGEPRLCLPVGNPLPR